MPNVQPKALALQSVVLAQLYVLLPAVPANAQATAPLAGTDPASAQTTLVAAGSHWRYYVMLSLPMVSQAQAKAANIPADAANRQITLDAGREETKTAPLLNVATAPPPEGWARADFDDRDWSAHRGPLRADPDGTPWPTDLSPEFALMCMRSKFIVDDPSAVKGLRLALNHRGGAVVYLNGQEVARSHLPAGALLPTTPADEYPPQATLLDDKTLLHWYRDSKQEGFKLRDRQAGPFQLDAGLLRKGVNVLAVELHRSDYPAVCRKIGMRWGANGLTEIHLTAQPAGGVRTSLARAAGLSVWNVDAAARLLDLDFADPAEPPGPMRIVGARNGTFSAAVAVGATAPLARLSAKLSDLKDQAGNTISSSAAKIRLGLLDGRDLDDRAHGVLAHTFDALIDAAEAPATLELCKTPAPNAARRAALGLPAKPVAGAVAPIWVSIKAPKDAAAGLYRGTLMILADGQTPVKVDVELDVRKYVLPDVKDYATLLNVYQSPDTLAIRYKAPLWSQAHWELIERSVALMGELGNDFICIPLLSKDQFGNEESMVQWRREKTPATASSADVGSFQIDFGLMEKYLDLFLKHHDPARIKCVVTVAWGSAASKDKASVTAIDGSGAKGDLTLPPYGSKECRELWRPVLEGLRQRLAKRGLDKAMMLGMPWDAGPKPEHVAMFRQLEPDLPWMRASHADGYGYPYDPANARQLAPLAMVERVWTGPVPHPSQARNLGWQLNRMRVSFNRDGYGALSLLGFRPPWAYRIWLEASLATGDRGAGRVGADFYDLGVKLDLRNVPGAFEIGTGNRGTIYNRYLSSTVGQIGLPNNTTDLCPPGPKGPVASIRYENAREGIQAAEAVIAVEKALVDKRLEGPRAEAAWKLVDERINALRLYHIRLGSELWQERTRRLFDLAGQLQG